MNPKSGIAHVGLVLVKTSSVRSVICVSPVPTGCVSVRTDQQVTHTHTHTHRQRTKPPTPTHAQSPKRCEEKHSNTTAHHPVVKPPAAASTAV